MVRLVEMTKTAGGVLVHRDEDSLYIVALRPREQMCVFFAPGTIFAEVSEYGVCQAVQRCRVANMEAFREMKRLESHARNNGVSQSGAELIYCKDRAPQLVMEDWLTAPHLLAPSPLGSVLSDVLRQDVWGRDHDEYCERCGIARLQFPIDD